MKRNLMGMVAGIGLILCGGLEAGAVSLQQAKAVAGEVEAGSEQLPEEARLVRSKKHREYTFKVLMNSGEEREFTGKIKFSNEDSTYALVSREEIIKASETKQIYRVDAVTGAKVTGTTYGSKWLFPVIEGKINGYSTYAENNPGYVTYISRNGGRQLYSFETRRYKAHEQTLVTLQEMVSGNEAADQLLREHKHKARRKQLTKNIALGGLGLAVIGVAAPVLGTALVVGAPAGLTAGVASVSVKTIDLLEVIAVYNSTEAIALF